MYGLRFWAQGLGFWAQGLGFRALRAPSRSLGFWAQGPLSHCFRFKM